MQRIFQDNQFTVASNEIGEGTTTITAPAGMSFYYYNPRFCKNAEEVHSALMHNDEGHAKTRMTAAGDYTLENWPFVILTQAQMEAIVGASMQVKQARSNLHDAEVAARLEFEKLAK